MQGSMQRKVNVINIYLYINLDLPRTMRELAGNCTDNYLENQADEYNTNKVNMLIEHKPTEIHGLG